MYYAQYTGVNLLIQLKIIRQKNPKTNKKNNKKDLRKSASTIHRSLLLISFKQIMEFYHTNFLDLKILKKE